jgi:PleD family two-component response regulator
MKKSFEEYSFIQTFVITALIFLIIVLLIEFFYALTQVSLEDALTGLANPKYLLRKLIGALIYAIIMTLYFKRKRKKAD